MSEFTIVTIADRRPKEPYYTYDEFFLSCARYGFKPLVLGTKPGEFNGLGSKPKLLQKAIQDGLVKTDYILFCDAFDIVFAKSPELIFEQTENDSYKDYDIIWNAEKNCFPDASLAEKHPETKSSFKYLNSGFGFGSTGAFLHCLLNMKADEIPGNYFDGKQMVHPNDQDYWMREFLFGDIDMELDTQCHYCQTMVGVEGQDLEFTKNGIRNIECDSYPIAFHFNGPAKTAGLREPILKYLNL